MIFCLLYIPCIATLATIKRESGSWKFTGVCVAFQLLLAWFVTFLEMCIRDSRIPVREGDGAVAGGRTGRQASVSDYRGGCDLSGAFLSDINCSLQEKRVLNHSGQQHFFQLAGGDIKRCLLYTSRCV